MAHYIDLGPEFQKSQQAQQAKLDSTQPYPELSQDARRSIEIGLGLVVNPQPDSYIITKSMRQREQNHRIGEMPPGVGAFDEILDNEELC